MQQMHLFLLSRLKTSLFPPLSSKTSSLAVRILFRFFVTKPLRRSSLRSSIRRSLAFCESASHFLPFVPLARMVGMKFFFACPHDVSRCAGTPRMNVQLMPFPFVAREPLSLPNTHVLKKTLSFFINSIGPWSFASADFYSIAACRPTPFSVVDDPFSTPPELCPDSAFPL